MRPPSGKRRARAHDVAIYAPSGALYYGRHRSWMGGAELQSTVLAHALKARGLRVAHIVYPVTEPRRIEASAPTLVERAEWQGDRRLGGLAEAAAIWRSCLRADAKAYIVRGSGGHMIAAAAFCRAFRRRLIFSSSSDLDFDFARQDRNPGTLRFYKASLRLADVLVVQTDRQRELARRAFPDVDPVVIPSFAEPAESVNGAARYFLWVDRLVEYKLPERYVELATALPDARFRMVAGVTEETPPGMAERIESAAGRLPNLELLPPRPRSQLLEEMEQAVAVVKTSRVEGMPNGFLEAWARGVPVLSLNVDPDSKIENNGIGVAAGGSMERFIDSAATLWGDPDVRKAIGERARQFVQEVHSPEAVTDRWAAVLKSATRAIGPERSVHGAPYRSFPPCRKPTRIARSQRS
jgi:glycosyltransferase involved in cell wall biosynthesis